MRIENSPEFQARMDKYAKTQEREQKKRVSALRKEYKRFWHHDSPFPPPWKPIETCPFWIFDCCGYQLDGILLVTNGEETALVDVHGRIGRPMMVAKEGEIVMRDGVLTYEGAEYREFDHPDWWFKWELRDVLDESYEYESLVHREIDFLPTHYMVLPKWKK